MLFSSVSGFLLLAAAGTVDGTTSCDVLRALREVAVIGRETPASKEAMECLEKAHRDNPLVCLELAGMTPMSASSKAFAPAVAGHEGGFCRSDVAKILPLLGLRAPPWIIGSLRQSEFDGAEAAIAEYVAQVDREEKARVTQRAVEIKSETYLYTLAREALTTRSGDDALVWYGTRRVQWSYAVGKALLDLGAADHAGEESVAEALTQCAAVMKSTMSSELLGGEPESSEERLALRERLLDALHGLRR